MKIALSWIVYDKWRNFVSCTLPTKIFTQMITSENVNAWKNLHLDVHNVKTMPFISSSVFPRRCLPLICGQEKWLIPLNTFAVALTLNGVSMNFLSREVLIALVILRKCSKYAKIRVGESPIRVKIANCLFCYPIHERKNRKERLLLYVSYM